MYELKKMEKYLRVNLLGPGSRLMKNEFTGPRSHKGCETLDYSKADSTRALKTRRLKRQTKRVVTPTEFSNEELCKNSRSNLDERF